MRPSSWTEKEIADFEEALARRNATVLEVKHLNQQGCSVALIAEILGLTEDDVQRKIKQVHTN